MLLGHAHAVKTRRDSHHMGKHPAEMLDEVAGHHNTAE